MTDLCPIDDNQKKCAIVGSDLINNLGRYISKTISPRDIAKVVDMSSNIFYNEGDTLRGTKKTLAVNLSNSGSWLRFNVSHLNHSEVRDVLGDIDCK